MQEIVLDALSIYAFLLLIIMIIIRSHINQLIIYQVEFLYTWLCN